MDDRGYVQVYTGNGKGKTTAALGIAARMLCSGGYVYLGQFMKGQDYSELGLSKHFKRLKHEQYGEPGFVNGKPTEKDILLAREGLRIASEALLSGKYDMVVLDEINTALHFGLVGVPEALALIAARPAHTELILTGRHAPEAIIEAADLVTEMREVKHYYSKGVKARVGIEK
ncbi:MAG: cob(I)yrinic acid a,c-diamide adenosyltransferase [Clostridiales Family XIII bacterium]|jgi:cob(I)alamin adenosyltransferase|nr:cob(I)yrinic acid a,c-diamide adenosyltransferase [Clostridiales Family XIII bacterium]